MTKNAVSGLEQADLEIVAVNGLWCHCSRNSRSCYTPGHMALQELIVGLANGLRKRIQPDEAGFTVIYEHQDPDALFPSQWGQIDSQHIGSDAPDADLFRQVSGLFPPTRPMS